MALKVEPRPVLVVSHDCSETELIPFFRESYGDDYRGDGKLIKKIRESDNIVTLRHPVADKLGAAALIAHHRITAPATSCDRELFGRRSSLMVSLLGACHYDIDPNAAQWVSIGVGYDRMQDAAINAGMQPLGEPDIAEKLLTDIGENDKYTLCYEDGGVLLTSPRPDGTMYEQNIWVWPDVDLVK